MTGGFAGITIDQLRAYYVDHPKATNETWAMNNPQLRSLSTDLVQLICNRQTLHKTYHRITRKSLKAKVRKNVESFLVEKVKMFLE